MHFLSSPRVQFRATKQHNPSLHQSFRSTKCSTPSKINHGSDARSQSNPIPHRSSQRSIASTDYNGTKPSIVGPSEDTWRSSSSKASSRSTSSPPRRFPDIQIHSLLGSRMWSPSTKRSTDFPTSIHTVYTLPFLPLCIAFMRIKYYSVLYILQYSRPATRR